MSSSVTPDTWRDPGVDVARHGDVDDQQRPAVAPDHDFFDVATLDEHAGRTGRGEQHVARRPARRAGRRARSPARRPASRAARRARGVRLATTTSPTPAPASATAMPSPTSPAPSTSTRRPASEPRRSVGERDRGGRDRHRVAADRGLGPRPLADLDGVAERPRQQLARRRPRAPRAATLRAPGRGSRPRR